MYYLFFDLETTGLPKNYKFGSFPDYRDLSNYDESRVLSMAFHLYDDKQHLLIKMYNIIYPDFEVKNSEIHGITKEIAEKEGIKWEDVIDLLTLLVYKCDFLIGHNVNFDISVLSAELYRRGYVNLARVVIEKQKVCTMLLGKNITKIKKEGFKDYKFPKLSELYFHLFQEEMKDAHNAEQDVINTVKCFYKMNK